MSRLDSFFGYAESHRVTVCVIGAALAAVVFWADAFLPIDMSFGFLYLIPIVLVAACLSSLQIVIVSAFCGLLREIYDPARGSAVSTGRLIAAGSRVCHGRFLRDWLEPTEAVAADTRGQTGS